MLRIKDVAKEVVKQVGYLTLHNVNPSFSNSIPYGLTSTTSSDPREKSLK